MAHSCAAACSQMASRNRFISLKITPPCPAGLRAWRSSFGSVVCGLRRGISLPSAWGFIAHPAALTAVAGVSSFCSLTSSLKNHSFKSWSSLVVIYVTSTPNITASSISLSNIGGQRSSIFVWQGTRQHSIRWKRMSSNASMTSPSVTFDGESFKFTFFSASIFLIVILF
jgi:hypothetical protein